MTYTTMNPRSQDTGTESFSCPGSRGATQSEDQLKMPLMILIFGEAKVQIGKHPNGKEYYCAAMADWTRLLGKEPKASDT